MKILVTGGAGFIGSFLTDELIRLGHSVRIFDNLEGQAHPGGKMPDYINKKAEFILGDVRDYDALKKAVEGIDIIFHQAAVVGLAQSLYEIKKYVDVNIGGTANLLNILANEKHNVKKLIVPGSMSSYGEGSYECKNCGKIRPEPRPVSQMEKGIWEILCPNCKEALKPIPVNEKDQLLGTFIYSITKKNQEEMSLIFGKAYNIPVTVLRYFSVYGPRQSLSNPYTGVAAIFLSRLMNKKPPMIYEDGNQLRDYVSVHDIVDANLLVMENKESDYRVFNVGSGEPITIIKIAEKLAEIIKSPIKPQVSGSFRKGDIRHCYADISAIKKLGFESKVSFEDGLKELVEWSGTQKAEDNFDKANSELKKRNL